MIHLTTLNYASPKSTLKQLDHNPEFEDLLTVGAMLNAVTHAREVAPWQLATFATDFCKERETIYLIGGLIYESILISKEILDRDIYKDNDKYMTLRTLREFRDTFELYSVPEIVIGPKHPLPFTIHEQDEELLRSISPYEGCREMLSLPEPDQRFAFATVVPDDTFRKRGAPDETLDMVLEMAVEDFAYAAEDFILTTAKRLGLKPTANLNKTVEIAV